MDDIISKNTGYIKVNGYSFSCNLIESGETNIYFASHASGVGLYYMAERDGDFAYSRTREKAIKNLEYLKQVKEIESKPLDFNMEMELGCFVFWYRYAVNACSDLAGNLLQDIRTRKIKPQDKYTLQQLICFSVNRFNHDIFMDYLSNLKSADRPILRHPNCEFCKKQSLMPFKCRTELLDRSK